MLNYYARFVNEVIKERKGIPSLKQRVDLMQLMMNAEIEEITPGTTKGLNRNEIIGNAIFMLIAGHDTTSSTISFLLYNLATHQEVQNSLIKDIDEAAAESGGFTYDSINKLKYLDMCVKETLRMYAPTLRNARCGNRDITINGFTIPKDVIVDIPLYEIHHDPEIWSDPFEFKPCRFEDNNSIDPMHFQPFGAGPRHCIGMRFAMMEIKVVACLLLREFTFLPAPGTPAPPLDPIFKVTVQPPNFQLKAVARNHIQ